jgi:serine protease Do
VVKNADQIIVVLADRREFAAELVLDDERTDLAVLRVDGEGERFPALDLRNSDELEVGDLVLAIGNPFGVGQTVTSGIVSALARTRVGVSDYQFFIQTDAAINPGNSGGALVSMDGRLVGVNTAIYSRTGGSVGIGFAIPANLVATLLETAKAGGKLVRPWLGASGQPVTADVAQGLGLDRPGGVVINSIYPGGPADEAGLRTGDVIVEVDGVEVLDTRALRFRVATKPLGGKAILTIIRDGKSTEVPINMVAAPEDPPRNITELRGRNPFAGALVGNLSPAFSDELGLDTLISGVIVLKTRSGSPAEHLRLRPGDIFLKLNGVDIKTVRQLQEALDGARAPYRVALQREGKVYNLVIGG